MNGWTVFIAAHAAGAVLALTLGTVMLRRRPKGNEAHRRLGRVWMVLMYWVVLSSFGITRLRPGRLSWIHGLSVFTFFSLTMAWRAARAGRVLDHRGWAVGSYLGLVGAFLGAVAVPARLVPRLVLNHPLTALAAVSGICIAAGFIVQATRIGMRPPLDRSLATGDAR